MNPLLLKTLDYCYGVLCRHCNRKVLDSDKERKQKYLEDTCPSCGKSGRDPVEEPEEEKKEEESHATD